MPSTHQIACVQQGQQERRLYPQQQFSRAAADEETGETDFFWDTHSAAVDPALVPGKHLESRATVGGSEVRVGGAPPRASSSPSMDGGDADSYPGATGFSVFTILKIVGTAF